MFLEQRIKRQEKKERRQNSEKLSTKKMAAAINQNQMRKSYHLSGQTIHKACLLQRAATHITFSRIFSCRMERWQKSYLLFGSTFSQSSVFASPLGLSLGLCDSLDDMVAAVTTALKLRFRFWTLSSGWKMMMYTFGMYSIPNATDALRFMEIVSVVVCM